MPLDRVPAAAAAGGGPGRGDHVVDRPGAGRASSATSAPLLTVLHWQTVAASGISAGEARPGAARGRRRAARPSSSARRSAGTGAPRSKSWITVPTAGLSPSRIAPASRSSRIRSRAYVPRAGSAKVDLLVRSGAGRVAHRGQVDAGRLEPGHRPAGAGSGPAGVRPVSTSASTRACSQAGATSPVTHAVVLGAVADRGDAPVAGAQPVVDHHAALDGQAGGLRRGRSSGRTPQASTSRSARESPAVGQRRGGRRRRPRPRRSPAPPAGR